MNYICEKCNHVFTVKGNYIRHINRKIPSVKEEKIEYIKNKLKCCYCNKQFASVQTLKYHQDGRCKKVIGIEPKIYQNEPKIYQNESKNKKLEKILADKDKQIEKVLQSVEEMKTSQQKLYKEISKLKSKIPNTINGNQMNVQNMVYNSTDTLNEKFEELLEKLDGSIVTKSRRFLDQKNDDDEIIKSIKKDLRLILYNKRKIPENTRMLTENMNTDIIEIK